MKKIGLLACSVLAAPLAVTAASWCWFSYDGFDETAGIVYANATTPLYTSMGAASIYLIDAAVTAQGDLLTGIRNADNKATYWSSVGKVDATTLGTDSKIADKPCEYGTQGKAYNFYYAIFDSANDKLLVTESVGDVAQEVGATELDFTSASDGSKQFFGTAGYSAGGWYAASVPEPFSGTLALLGMVGLGLRRKLKKQKQA